MFPFPSPSPTNLRRDLNCIEIVLILFGIQNNYRWCMLITTYLKVFFNLAVVLLCSFLPLKISRNRIISILVANLVPIHPNFALFVAPLFKLPIITTINPHPMHQWIKWFILISKKEVLWYLYEFFIKRSPDIFIENCWKVQYLSPERLTIWINFSWPLGKMVWFNFLQNYIRIFCGCTFLFFLVKIY